VLVARAGVGRRAKEGRPSPSLSHRERNITAALNLPSGKGILFPYRRCAVTERSVLVARSRQLERIRSFSAIPVWGNFGAHCRTNDDLLDAEDPDNLGRERHEWVIQWHREPGYQPLDIHFRNKLRRVLE